ncbi:hypothetical protein Tsubulata_010975 [Turnera subulata]|uniref:SET domain-containing protein n=1 Tax=Turnera subulata TaxID=218843 RepID=A0A9Q0GCY8_9ROSI|nr:hypothetical protein Tsubulata_010975 [Turnera subulata]
MVENQEGTGGDGGGGCFEKNDITKGEEAVEITWVNEVNKERLPYFNYIPTSFVLGDACVDFSLSRIPPETCCSSCVGDCLSSSSSSTPCACSLVQAGNGNGSGSGSGSGSGGFAYTRDGLVRDDFLEDCISMSRDPKRQSHSYCTDCPLQRSKGECWVLAPCGGHLRMKSIQECGNKCWCHKLCGNRVVQRGITSKLQALSYSLTPAFLRLFVCVFYTPQGKGWGVRTLDKLPKGAFVCEFVGEILTTHELSLRNMEMTRNKTTPARPAPLDAYWPSHPQNHEQALFLDPTFHGNVARFINHRCLDANLIEIPVKIETPDDHYYHLAFFTTREVNVMEELTLDYGIEFDDVANDDFVEAFRCLCHSKFCRDLRRSKTPVGSTFAFSWTAPEREVWDLEVQHSDRKQETHETIRHFALLLRCCWK